MTSPQPSCSLECSQCRSMMHSSRRYRVSENFKSLHSGHFTSRMTSPNPLHVSYLGQILLRYGNPIFFGWLEMTRSWWRPIEFISCWLWSTEVPMDSWAQYSLVGISEISQNTFTSPTCILVTSRLNKLVPGSSDNKLFIMFTGETWMSQHTL